MVKYYYAGGQRVVLRKGTTTKQRYYPWGATRYSSGGAAPTAFQYTGQRNDSPFEALQTAIIRLFNHPIKTQRAWPPPRSLRIKENRDHRYRNCWSSF